MLVLVSLLPSRVLTRLLLRLKNSRNYAPDVLQDASPPRSLATDTTGHMLLQNRRANIHINTYLHAYIRRYTYRHTYIRKPEAVFGSTVQLLTLATAVVYSLRL